MKEIRVRNAPSPTGFLHIGSVRTFLYNYLFARKNNGKYLLRVEDTDQTRLVPGALENIVQTLEDIGITTDEGPYWDDNQIKYRGEYGPYIQSQRLEIYKKYAQELLDKKVAYYCFCTSDRLTKLREEQQAAKLPPKYDKLCLKLSDEEVAQKISAGEPHVIRFNVPTDRIVEFEDAVHGKIRIPSKDVDDQVLLKSDGFPTYHLAVVIDDYLMKITHVIRADEWIASTPKHVMLYEAFGWELPVFVHLPAVLSKATGKKMSKREGDVAARDFLEKGYLPEAIVNFLAFLGWNPKTEQEIFSMEELIENFSLDKLNKAGAVFDLDKLDWFNGMYIRNLSLDELYKRIEPYLVKANIPYQDFPKEFVLKVLALEQGRLKKLSEIGERINYFFSEPEYDPSLLVWKKSEKSTIQSNLQKTAEFLQNLPIEKYALKEVEEELKQFIQSNDLKTGEVLWPLRVALSGLDASPGPFELIDALSARSDGKEIIIKRVTKAAQSLL